MLLDDEPSVGVEPQSTISLFNTSMTLADRRDSSSFIVAVKSCVEDSRLVKIASSGDGTGQLMCVAFAENLPCNFQKLHDNFNRVCEMDMMIAAFLWGVITSVVCPFVTCSN